MSHELRTPLNSLLILAEQLEDNPDHTMTEKQVEYATVILASGRDLLELLNNILDLAKAESGTVIVDMEASSMSSTFATPCIGSSSMLLTTAASGSRSRSGQRSRTDRHRPATVPSDPEKPAGERLQVHRARRGSGPLRCDARRAELRSALPVRCGIGLRRSRCRTPGSASVSPTSSGSSRRSHKATERPLDTTAAPGLACRSVVSWSVCSAARSLSTARRAGQHVHRLPAARCARTFNAAARRAPARSQAEAPREGARPTRTRHWTLAV